MLSSFGSLKCCWNFKSFINGNSLLGDAIFATDLLLCQMTQQVKKKAKEPLGGTGNLVVVQLESSSDLLPIERLDVGFPCCASTSTQLQRVRATRAG